jgi:hypothetical protein
MENVIMETASAIAIASLLTNLFKMAMPDASSAVLVAVSLAVGVLSSLLFSLAGGDVLTTQSVAVMIIQGIFAAGAAAGIDRTAVAAQAKRDQAI